MLRGGLVQDLAAIKKEKNKMAMDDLLADFESAMDKVTTKVTGTDSIYDKTLTKFNDLYTTMGMDARSRNEAIATVSAQLAISVTDKAISAAVDLAKTAPMLDAQVATEEARKSLIERQEEGFNDKLKVEAMNGMLGIGQMEATSGETQADTLLAANKTMNIVYKAAGETDNVFTE